MPSSTSTSSSAASGAPIASELAELVLATTLPSAILRVRDSDARDAMRTAMVADLRLAADFLRA